MSQTKTEIQALLASADTSPRHRFGQNFMIDQNLVRLIAAAGDVTAGDCLIEVGPGTGTLTEELLETPCAKLLAVEIDRDLAGLLRERFFDRPTFSLLEGDALSGKHALNDELSTYIEGARAGGGRVKLIANLPYNIASPLVIELLLAGVDLLAFTVQKEVADRFIACTGEGYGPLSVMVQMLSKPRVLRTLPPQAFWPPPKIDSALVRLDRHDQLGPAANDFSRFVQKIFSFRRKTLRKAMSMADLPAEPMLAATNLDGTVRPEELSPEQFLQLFRAAGSNLP